jgi:cell division protein FtsI/penicillin-binding protein 2
MTTLAAAGLVGGTLSGCGAGHEAGPPPSTPARTLDAFVAGWDHRSWPTMAGQVDDPPADFAPYNATVLTDLGATAVAVRPGIITRATTGTTASAPVTERYTVAGVGTVAVGSRVELHRVGSTWKVEWTDRTVDPRLGPGDHFARTATFARRAAITGADGTPLVSTGAEVQVGIEGKRVQDRAAVSRLLIQGGATASEVSAAFAEAKAHPAYFVAVFDISRSDFETTVRSSPLYAIRGTEFVADPTPTAVTSGLADYVVGSIGPVTAEQLHRLGPDYAAGDDVGQDGLEAQYETRLAGTPGVTVTIVDARGRKVAAVASSRPHAGTPVATSISVPVQRAAETAIAGTTVPSALVAVQASTGRLLAVATHDPTNSGVDYALDALEAPGSTFKTVTSTALIEDRGLTPASPATCPATRTVDGEVFHNDEGEASGPIDLATAFAQSCNTAFVGLATSDLTAAQLVAAARSYDLGVQPRMGLGSYAGNVPTPTDEADLASTAIGQGQITVSPLDMAMVAADIDSGTVRLPRLVTGAPDDRAPTHALPVAVRTDLAEMMGEVVTSGTAAGKGLPAGTKAKTGTAEFGSASPPQTHAWLIGYRGDIAFAVWVNVGASGGAVAAPLAASFLTAVGSDGT